MNTNEKKEIVSKLVNEILTDSLENMKKNISKAIDSGAIDIDSWDNNNHPMILPKIIVTALLERESEQYKGKDTCFEKEVKKGVKNLKYFL